MRSLSSRGELADRLVLLGETGHVCQDALCLGIVLLAKAIDLLGGRLIYNDHVIILILISLLKSLPIIKTKTANRLSLRLHGLKALILNNLILKRLFDVRMQPFEVTVHLLQRENMCLRFILRFTFQFLENDSKLIKVLRFL